ncbi:uncharacterized protein K489DRAFT_133680 [Dissoconium aciculare CBS 342.82]|uniref:Uncharacterized protein n=1 Tax=Dissoconium aciculare CBS 342.82 TaxID=1314786 RepID=A0A6J3LQH7_9PEZI|nr:uncharacterized protein K489DRAFT_133680 [Dissoconium aciculare CBS 342.82]KAF1818146.1 hypothetical protein K489DRAFT_133680 [Dissoconium aciculare CBS 342.82]
MNARPGKRRLGDSNASRRKVPREVVEKRSKGRSLDEDADLRRDSEVRNAIVEVWQISFGYIRQVRRPTTLFLSMMRFCSCQVLPRVVTLHARHSRNKSHSLLRTH